jgi:hypothetical protein
MCSPAVLAFGDVALELQILDRVIFRLDRQPSLRRIERRPLANRPRLEHAAHLQTKIKMQVRRVVLLHDEAAQAALRQAPARLRRAPEVPLLPVGFEAHC